MNPTMNTTTHTTTEPTHERIEATVTAFGHIQPSRYNNEQVQSVLFERWDRSDESRKVWKTFSVAEARRFHKNQHVLLVPTWHNNRQMWEVEPLDEPTASMSPPYPKRSDYQEPEPEAQHQAYPAQATQSPAGFSRTSHPRPRLQAPSRQQSKRPSQCQPSAASTGVDATGMDATGMNANLSPAEKQEIATWISHQADLYACCFSEAHRALSTYQPEEETVRACASSLFISATRKFRLEV